MIAIFVLKFVGLSSKSVYEGFGEVPESDFGKKI